MSKKTETELSDVPVEDLLSMFKDPVNVDAKGKCTFIRKVETLPENVQEAIHIACANKEVTNREILAFINLKTDAQANITMIQDHRHRDGCLVCMYGTAKA